MLRTWLCLSHAHSVSKTNKWPIPLYFKQATCLLWNTNSFSYCDKPRHSSNLPWWIDCNHVRISNNYTIKQSQQSSSARYWLVNSFNCDTCCIPCSTAVPTAQLLGILMMTSSYHRHGKHTSEQRPRIDKIAVDCMGTFVFRYRTRNMQGLRTQLR